MNDYHMGIILFINVTVQIICKWHELETRASKGKYLICIYFMVLVSCQNPHEKPNNQYQKEITFSLDTGFAYIGKEIAANINFYDYYDSVLYVNAIIRKPNKEHFLPMNIGKSKEMTLKLIPRDSGNYTIGFHVYFTDGVIRTYAGKVHVKDSLNIDNVSTPCSNILNKMHFIEVCTEDTIFLSNKKHLINFNLQNMKNPYIISQNVFVPIFVEVFNEEHTFYEVILLNSLSQHYEFKPAYSGKYTFTLLPKNLLTFHQDLKTLGLDSSMYLNVFVKK